MSDEPADDFNSIDGEKVFDDYDDARAAYDASWKQYENDLDQARNTNWKQSLCGLSNQLSGLI